MIIGIDEAGRGPVTGPLVLAAVGATESELVKLEALALRDSKLLSLKQREDFEKKIKEITQNYHIVVVSASEIDNKRKVMSLNELEAMKTAELIEKFNKITKVIIDLPDPRAEMYKRRISKYTKIDGINIVAEHKADMNYKICSAASILAKQKRDRAVRRIEKENNIILGSGYPHDERTIKTLENYAQKRERPTFVRYSWETARRIWGKVDQKKLFDF